MTTKGQSLEKDNKNPAPDQPWMHLEWQRYIERFGTIVMSKDAFKLILESLSEEKLVDLAFNIANKVPRNLFHLNGRISALLL